jgi:hypothetical protein
VPRDSLSAYAHEATLDVGNVVLRVVQRVFEQAAHVAPFAADGEPAGPGTAPGIVSQLSEMRGLCVELIDDVLGIGVGVGRRSRFDQVAADGWKRRLIEGQSLLDSKGM